MQNSSSEAAQLIYDLGVSELLLPQYAHLVGQFAMVLEVGEGPIIFWLLIWGAKAQPIDAPAS